MQEDGRERERESEGNQRESGGAESASYIWRRPSGKPRRYRVHESCPIPGRVRIALVVWIGDEKVDRCVGTTRYHAGNDLPRRGKKSRGERSCAAGRRDFRITNNDDGGAALCCIVRGSNKGLLIPDSIAEKVITRCRCHARLERGKNGRSYRERRHPWLAIDR